MRLKILIVLMSLFLLVFVVGEAIVEQQIVQTSVSTHTISPYVVKPILNFEDYVSTEPGYNLDTVNAEFYYEYEDTGDTIIEHIRGVNVTIGLSFEDTLYDTTCDEIIDVNEEPQLNCTTISTPFTTPDDFYLTARSTSLDDIIYFDTDLSGQEIASNWNKQQKDNDGMQNITLTFNGKKLEVVHERYISAILNFTDFADFQLHLGTGSTVTNFTWETEHLQNNTVRDVFIYEKDFLDNKSSDWYINSNYTFNDNLILLMHFNNETLTDTLPDYNLDNDTLAYDYSPQQINGTFDSSKTYWNCSAGIPLGNCGIELNPPENYINLTGFASTTQQYTMAGWVNTKHPNSGNSWLFYSQTGNFPIQVVQGSDLRYVTGGSTKRCGTPNVLKDTWTHIAFTFDGDNSLGRCYVNGVETATSGLSWNPTDLGGGFVVIGSHNGDKASSFNGTIDEFMIYNRTFTPSEIATLYQRSANDYEISGGDYLVGNPGFPNLSYIAAHDVGVDIVDANTDLLWMRFMEDSGNVLDASTFNTVTAKDGSIYVGSDLGLYDIDFDNDTITRYNATGYSKYAGDISTANDGDGYPALTKATGKEVPIDTDGSRGLVAHYHFNNETSNATVLYDYSTAQLNGTIVSNNLTKPLYNTTDAKVGNAGMQFDGDGDYVNIDGLLNKVSGNRQGTIMAWINFNDYTRTNQIFTCGDTDANERIILYTDTSGQLHFYIADAGTAHINIDTDASPFTKANTWYHVAVTQKTGDDVKLYVNGEIPAQTYATSANINSWFVNLGGLDNCRIGEQSYNNQGGKQYPDGVIDELTIWNRTLSSAEIVSYIANTSATYVPVRSVEVVNNTGTTLIVSGTDDGINIINKSDDSMVGSWFKGPIDVMVKNSTESIYYASNLNEKTTIVGVADSDAGQKGGNATLGVFYNIDNQDYTFTSSLNFPYSRITSLAVNGSDVFIGDGGGVLKLNNSLTVSNQFDNLTVDTTGVMAYWMFANQTDKGENMSLSSEAVDEMQRYNCTNKGQTDSNSWWSSDKGGPSSAVRQYSLEFDELDDYCEVSDNIFNPLDDWSVCGWMWSSDTSNLAYMGLGKSGSAFPYMYLGYTGGGAGLKYSYISARNDANALTTVGLGNINMPLSQWNYVCITHDKESDRWTAFNNGGVNTEIQDLAGTYNNLNELEFGGYNDGTNDFKGYMSHFAIWNRTLSVGEMTAMYDQSKQFYTTNENYNRGSLNMLEILSGYENGNVSALAINGTDLYVGTQGTDGAVSEIDLSTNTNTNNWSSINISSNFTNALDFFGNNSLASLLIGGQAGMNSIETVIGAVSDAIAPTVENTFPINNTNFSISNQKVNLTYNVTDAGGGIANCSLFIDNNINTSDDTITEEVNQTFNITFSEGNYDWLVQCEDDSSNLGNSSSFTFTLDNTAPTVEIVFPPNNTNQSTQFTNLTYNVTDSLLEVDTCELIIDDELNSSDFEIPKEQNQTFNITFADGSYKYNVQCNDTINNKANSSAFNITIDTTGPIVTLDVPVNQTTFSFSPVEFNYTVLDNSTVNNCTLNYATNTLTDTTITQNTILNLTVALTDTDFFWNVTCRDSLNNLGTSETRKLIISLNKGPSSVGANIGVPAQREINITKFIEAPTKEAVKEAINLTQLVTKTLKNNSKLLITNFFLILSLFNIKSIIRKRKKK